jgi:uncharacterized protein YndB with AHSA1/START domain
MEKFIENKIFIEADSEKVWDLLVNPGQTKKYMFGCETVSDWKPGSPLEWKMLHEGKEFIPVKGKVVEITPGKFLAYTVIDPHSQIPDIPENYLTVSYSLMPGAGGTLLTVTQGDYAKVADGEKRYNESYNNGEGWNPILLKIKKLAEAANN